MLPAALLLFAVSLFSCTDSPFDTAEIDAGNADLRGRVRLQEADDHSGVYVWMEGLNLGTFTNAEGRFLLHIPESAQVAGKDGLSGVFRLFFFVANYDVQTADVVLRNGAFVYGEGDVTEDGDLRFVPTLAKRLDIYTIVVPKWAHSRFRGDIHVQVTLRATHDSVQVVFPGSVGGLLGGILFRDRDSGEVFTNLYDPGAKDALYDTIGLLPRSRRLIFHLHQLEFRLPIGDYEVVPYFLIENLDVPAALLRSLGPQIEAFGPQFLKIPTRRRGGQFRIID